MFEDVAFTRKSALLLSPEAAAEAVQELYICLMWDITALLIRGRCSREDVSDTVGELGSICRCLDTDVLKALSGIVEDVELLADAEAPARGSGDNRDWLLNR